MSKQKVSTKTKLAHPEYSLGERLKFIRESRNLTQNELAHASGLTQSTIANIEKENKDPSIQTLEKIAKCLDIHIATLFSTEDVYVFDLKRLRRKYTKAEKLTPHLYMALGQVIQYARHIGFL
jgi:transcriptional regulator with XRE-family HTH domain